MPTKTWIPLLLAAGGLTLAIFAQQSTRLGRQSNLEVPAGFLQVFVTSKVGDPGRCQVSDRGDAAVRRSDPELQSARWRCQTFGDASSAQPIFAALDGKRASFLFVPYRHVVDPAWPLLYEELRKTAGEKPLPRLRWVHLFLDRVYHGFYLQATLPSNDFVQENQLARMETLSVAGPHAACFDRKARNVCPIHTFLVAESIFPAMPWTPALARLDGLLPDDLPRHFLVEDVEEKTKSPIRPWPLPFDLRAMLTDDAHPVQPIYDDRFRRWTAPEAGAEAPPAVDAAGWRRDLAAALVASCQVVPCDETDRRRLAQSPTLRWLESSP